MLRVRIFAFALTCMMVAPQADAQGRRGNSSGVPGQISNIQAIIDAVLAQIAALPDSTELQEQLADLQSDLGTLTEKLETATGDIANLISRVAALEAAGGGMPIIWSGGCTVSVGGATSQYVRYCADDVDFNSAASHLTVDPNGTFTASIAGTYSISFWSRNQGQTGSVQVRVNGAPIAEGLNFGGGTATIRDQSADVTWPLGVDDTVEIRVLSAGAVAYGAWRHPATGAAQSRLQIEYLGPPVALAPPPPPPPPAPEI